MAPGAPRGKRKPTRGGPKSFSRNLSRLDADDGIPDSIVDTNNAADSSEEEESSEEEKQELTREERRAAAKAKKEAAKAKAAALAGGASGSEDEEDDDAPKPVAAAAAAAPKIIKTSNPNDPANVASAGPSRREREAMEAAAAKERYWKLHQQGKTDQAKADLERLAKIRAEREEKARQRLAEAEERKKEAEAKADAKGRRR
ncbi:casein kinase substrate phosphoprotein PP28-domain-containing protein [Pyronema omphalodes]|nr:casein kinase substrate phosphoprotein PP28-domain-containing protein [Pyronema omphalodes]